MTHDVRQQSVGEFGVFMTVIVLMFSHVSNNTLFVNSATFQNSYPNIQEAQLSQRDRAAACLNFDKNISANSVHLTLLYVTALTSTNQHFTVLRYHVCT